MKEDIPLIAERLLEMLCKEHDARWPRKILPDAMDLLKTHFWPDNVRELRNVLERAVKNNKDIELIVPSDIYFDSLPIADIPKRAVAGKDAERHILSVSEIEQLIETIGNFEFPKDYGKLSGRLPTLQEAVAKLMARYLTAAIEVTKRVKPGQVQNGEINITGAASCIMGEQLKTPKAADIVKRILQSDRKTLEDLLKNSPVLSHVYSEVLKLRPKKPK
jgi:DNA-binding NtrC family response regulator